MGRANRSEEQIPVLSPGDSLLRAMSMMERARMQLLPVVCAGGMLVGLITESRLLEMWSEGPLESVASVMTPVTPGSDSRLLPTG